MEAIVSFVTGNKAPGEKFPRVATREFSPCSMCLMMTLQRSASFSMRSFDIQLPIERNNLVFMPLPCDA